MVSLRSIAGISLLPLAVCAACSGSEDQAGPRGAGSGGTEAGGSAGSGGAAGSDASQAGSGGSAGSDAGGSADADADAGPCTGPLESVKSALGVTCPDFFVQAQNLCAWAVPSVSDFHLRAGTCDGLAVTSVDLLPLSAGLQCYYNAGSGTLVGAHQWEDNPGFCNQTSFDLFAGTVPASCPPDQLGAPVICSSPDAGDAATD